MSRQDVGLHHLRAELMRLQIANRKRPSRGTAGWIYAQTDAFPVHSCTTAIHYLLGGQGYALLSSRTARIMAAVRAAVCRQHNGCRFGTRSRTQLAPQTAFPTFPRFVSLTTRVCGFLHPRGGSPAR